MQQRWFICDHLLWGTPVTDQDPTALRLGIDTKPPLCSPFWSSISAQKDCKAHLQTRGSTGKAPPLKCICLCRKMQILKKNKSKAFESHWEINQSRLLLDFKVLQKLKRNRAARSTLVLHNTRQYSVVKYLVQSCESNNLDSCPTCMCHLES